MSIKINIQYFDGSDFCEDDQTYKSQASPLGRLVENVAKATEGLDELTNPQFNLNAEDAKLCGVSDPSGDIAIDIVLIDNKEVFEYFNAPDNSLGFHAITSGAYESIDDDCIAAKHRVFVMVDEAYLARHIQEERDQEINPESSAHDHEYLNAYLTTVTHEIAHCVEFITNANGLTPSQVYNESENGNLGWALEEISTGHGILFPYDESLSSDEIVDIMEERVEQKGIDWLCAIDIDAVLFSKALSEYAPETLALKGFIGGKQETKKAPVVKNTTTRGLS
jgi:hypothetical protein